MSKIVISKHSYAELSDGSYGYYFSGAAIELVEGDSVTLTITTEDGSIMQQETLRASNGSDVLSWDYSEIRKVKPHTAVAKVIGQDGAEKASDTAQFSHI